MADGENARRRRGEEDGEVKKIFEKMEWEKSELLLQLEAERQRHRNWEENRRISVALYRVLTYNAYMASILSIAPENSICRCHPWVLNFLLVAISISFTCGWAANLMFEHNICRRFVNVLKDIAVAVTAVTFGTALSSVVYFGVLKG